MWFKLADVNVGRPNTRENIVEGHARTGGGSMISRISTPLGRIGYRLNAERRSLEIRTE